MQAAGCGYVVICRIGDYNVIMHKFFLTVLLAALVFSCDNFLGEETLEANQFYAKNLATGSFYKVAADLLAEGRKCVVWAEKGSGVSGEQARKIANEYDENIRDKIVDAFGMKDFDYRDNHFDDILDYANWLAGRSNRKLTVLLLDIKDKYPETNAYVAGYFYPGNFYSRNQNYSNGCDMIYIDTNPGMKHPETAYMTFAHELQHLINYATTTLTGRHAMDTWIDEGLSSQAEHIYNGGNIVEKCNRIRYDPKGTIAKGNNFFVWDNHLEVPDAILDEYATVYVFFRWLYLQAGSPPQFFYEIETSGLSDYSAITNVAKNINSDWNNWEKLLGSWLAANYYPANADYGYKGDSYLQGAIKVKTISDKSIKLYPGEGVYSKINSSYTPPASGANIRYAGLSGSSSGISEAPPFASSDTLLTFNANINNKSTQEPGSLTGVSAGISAVKSPIATDGGQEETHNGPYVIDARDLPGWLGRSK